MIHDGILYPLSVHLFGATKCWLCSNHLDTLVNGKEKHPCPEVPVRCGKSTSYLGASIKYVCSSRGKCRGADHRQSLKTGRVEERGKVPGRATAEAPRGVCP